MGELVMSADATKRSALVVDANAEDLARVTKIFDGCGLSVVTATNAEEARTRIRFQKFDILMIDAALPKESGIQLLIALHEAASKNGEKDFPAVLLTAKDPISEEIRAKLTKYLGVKAILAKPVEPQPIIDFVNSKFANKSRTHAYDAATLNKFINATREIIALNSQIAPVPGKAFVRIDGQALGEFTGIIEIRSKTQQGFVALSFERPCCETMARKILGDAAMTLNDAILRDISGEMCNQVVGNVQAQFQREGTRFEISTPTIVSGLKYRVDHNLEAPSIVIPFEWNGTRFYTQFVMANLPAGALAKPEAAPAVKDEQKEGDTMDSGDINFL
jgi:chemotaxis protein CheX